MVFVFLCLHDVPILSDVVVVHNVMHFKILQLLKWWKTKFVTAAGKSSSSLHIEESDFTYLILREIFYLVDFSCTNYHFTVKYKTEKRIAK